MDQAVEDSVARLTKELGMTTIEMQGLIERALNAYPFTFGDGSLWKAAQMTGTR